MTDRIDDGMKTPEELLERFHEISLGGHSLTGKLRDDKDALARLVTEEVEAEREACASIIYEADHMSVDSMQHLREFRRAIRARGGK